MSGKSEQRLSPAETSEHWVWELLIPGLFSLILIGCLWQLASYAMRGQAQPVVSFHYAVPAFAL